MFTPKDDKHGLGYKGLDPSTALFGREDWLGIDPVSTRAGKKGISGQVQFNFVVIAYYNSQLFTITIIIHTRQFSSLSRQ